MPDFRPVPENRLDEFQSMVRYAFYPEQGPSDDSDDEGDGSDQDETPESERIGEAYGLFEGDDLRAVCRLIEFTTRVRGRAHSLDGLSAVASPPETRRRGFTSQMLHDALAESRDRGTYLSALWPFKRSFYANYGWATSNRGVRHECDPEVLSFALDYRHGEFVRLDADDWERLDAVHDQHGADYELTMERTEEWWRNRVFEGWREDPYVYGWERDGQLAAYVAYSFDSGEEDTLQVRDWAHVDHDARLALLRFLADHDSQVDQIGFWTPPSEDVLDLVPDGDDIESTLSLAPMFRLVDVPRALEALPFPDETTTDLVLDIADPLADWNDDTYRLEVVNGTATVERSDEDPDARLGVGALSQLYVGYRSADELATVGDVEADAATVDELGELLPESQPLMREGF
ncbi:GNAT family N-acetyltransferase [Halobacterium zhouii]|uniref:GNAT family N-acetyltransferase n=1 Tax=Halobacterium zhouii TaxID=2902624 RepID=UPI001E29F3C7|nr:GNAT family N-acetyltransferase [Halobacterium zhouii]